MMPMKKLLLLSLVLLCSLSAWTAQRSPEEALSIARTFFMQSSGAVTRNIGEVQLVAVSNDLHLPVVWKEQPFISITMRSLLML